MLVLLITITTSTFKRETVVQTNNLTKIIIVNNVYAYLLNALVFPKVL